MKCAMEEGEREVHGKACNFAYGINLTRVVFPWSVSGGFDGALMFDDVCCGIEGAEETRRV